MSRRASIAACAVLALVPLAAHQATTCAAGETTSPAAASAAPAPQALIGLLAALGRSNGQALACGLQQASGEARALALRWAPRTTEAGGAFERGTTEGYAAQLKSATPCPGAAEASVAIAALGQQLAAQAAPAHGHD